MTIQAQSLHDAFTETAPPPFETDGFFTGTITAIHNVAYRAFGEPMQFELADVELDTPFNGSTFARARLAIRPTDRDFVGTRLRGKMFVSDDEKQQLTRHGMTGWNAAYWFMQFESSSFFDFRTLHVALDDAKIQASGDATRIMLDLGLNISKAEDYYISNGIHCGAIVQEPGLPDAPKPVLWTGTPYTVSP